MSLSLPPGFGGAEGANGPLRHRGGCGGAARRAERHPVEQAGLSAGAGAGRHAPGALDPQDPGPGGGQGGWHGGGGAICRQGVFTVELLDASIAAAAVHLFWKNNTIH